MVQLESKPRNAIDSEPKLKTKFDMSEIKIFICVGRDHLAKDSPNKKEGKKKVYANFSNCHSYESSDDDDIDHVNNVESAHVARCLMAKSHTNSNIFF